MKLPKKGMLVDQDTGQVLWAWEFNDPDHDFDVTQPMIEDEAGHVRPLDAPHSVIIDCDATFEQGDMNDIYKEMGQCRMRKQADGHWEICQCVEMTTTAGTEMTEIEHPIMAKRRARAAARRGPA